MFHHCAAGDWRGRILLSKRQALLQRAPGKTTPPTGAQGCQDTSQEPDSKTTSKYGFVLLLKANRPAHPEDSSDDNGSSVSGVPCPEMSVSPQTV